MVHGNEMKYGQVLARLETLSTLGGIWYGCYLLDRQCWDIVVLIDCIILLAVQMTLLTSIIVHCPR